MQSLDLSRLVYLHIKNTRSGLQGSLFVSPVRKAAWVSLSLALVKNQVAQQKGGIILNTKVNSLVDLLNRFSRVFLNLFFIGRVVVLVFALACHLRRLQYDRQVRIENSEVSGAASVRSRL
jgi:hypothetical protein